MKKVVLFFSFVFFFLLAFNIGQAQEKPFNGTNLKGWKAVDPNAVSKWIVGRAAMDSENPRALYAQTLLKKDKKFVEGDLINFAEANWTEEPRGGIDLYTEKKYGDCVVELEFMVPQGSNSGVYLMGEYEVQVADSWGREKLGQGDLGAIYSAAAPAINAALAPGKWQHYMIDFQAPRFDADGKKIQNAKFLKITLNGKVVQENVEVQGQTGGGITGKEAPTGPLMLQGNHGPVAYRNIKITEKK